MAREARVIYAPAGEELFAPAGLVAAGSFERQFRASLVPLAPNAEFRDLSPVVGQMLTYTTDLCRTWPVSGRFSAVQRKYYDIVLEAQEAAISAIRPGDMMLDVIKAAARVFQKHGLEPNEDIATMGVDRVWGIMPSPTHYLTRDAGIVRYNSFGRGVRDLGHHIGLEVQDSRDYSKPLAPGMVITVEPKIYIPDRNIAIMIEDMILVTPDGNENLSASTPKKADEIERIMADGRRAKAWR